MSLFTEIVKTALGASLSQGQAESKTENLLTGALGMLESMGGVGALVKKFQQSGLGDLAASWVGTGENKEVSADQITNVLGKDQVKELAQQAGIPEEQGATVLSKVLPEMINKMTPDGKEPESSGLSTWAKVLIGGAGIAGVAAAAKAASSYFGNKEQEQPAAAAEQQSGTSSVAPTAEAVSSTSERTYTVASGDTLSKIAKNYYNDANQWPRIFDANRDTLSNPDLIHPGQTLRIP